MTTGGAKKPIEMKALVIITKLMDVISTVVRIRKYHQETKPFAQNLMSRIGNKKSAWIVFGLAFFIVVVTGSVALYGPVGFQGPVRC